MLIMSEMENSNLSKIRSQFPRTLSFMNSRRAYLYARILLTAVFLYAGASKLPAPKDFATVIGGYGLLPEPLLFPVAVVLPVLEILAAMALLLDVRGSLAIITGFTLMFIGVLAHGIRLGLDIDCGCYGPGDPEGEAYHNLWEALYRDLLLLVVCGYCYWWRFVHKPGLRGLFRFWSRSDAKNESTEVIDA